MEAALAELALQNLEPEPEDDADDEDAGDVHVDGRVRDDERRPRHVEEDDVDGGGPRGDVRREEVGEERERYEEIHGGGGAD